MSQTVTYGEIDWNSDVGGDKGANNKDIWLRLNKGPNDIRVLGPAYLYISHRYKKEGDSGFGQKIYCSAINGSCPLCDMGIEAKRRWLLPVISRTTGKYQILDVTSSVYYGIKDLNSHQKWGNPLNYDCTIIVNPTAVDKSKYYTVQPNPKEPLSASDQFIRDNEYDPEDLKRRVTPPTPEFVQKRIDKINGEVSDSSAGSFSNGKKAVPSAKPTPPVKPVVNMSDDTDDTFPAYDA